MCPIPKHLVRREELTNEVMVASKMKQHYTIRILLSQGYNLFMASDTTKHKTGKIYNFNSTKFLKGYKVPQLIKARKPHTMKLFWSQKLLVKFLKFPCELTL
jgi:hypothetical protein